MRKTQVIIGKLRVIRARLDKRFVLANGKIAVYNAVLADLVQVDGAKSVALSLIYDLVDVEVGVRENVFVLNEKFRD